MGLLVMAEILAGITSVDEAAKMEIKYEPAPPSATNCVNCGAAYETGQLRCSYCGTPHVPQYR